MLHEHGEPPVTASHPRPLAARLVAFIEVVLCSDYPTQLAIAGAFNAAGVTPFGADGRLSTLYVVGLSLIDTAVLIALIVLFLRAHGERPHDVLLGQRQIGREAAVGLPLVLVALLIGAGVLGAIQLVAPSLHNVNHNPLQDLIERPRDAWLFALVVIAAGGVREEIQRAFLLHRFDVWLGGGALGIVVCSIAFGAGHLVQGTDAAFATGALGVFWGIIYLRRRSVVAPMVSHAGFNLLEIAEYLITGK